MQDKIAELEERIVSLEADRDKLIAIIQQVSDQFENNPLAKKMLTGMGFTLGTTNG